MNQQLIYALARAADVWDETISNVDAEQAYLDRTVLALAVIELRKDLAAALDQVVQIASDLDAMTQHDEDMIEQVVVLADHIDRLTATQEDPTVEQEKSP